MKSNTSTDKAFEMFAEMMITKIESVSTNWQKPWFTSSASNAPRNIDGRYYNGSNSLLLMMYSEMKGYELPIFGTFERFIKLNENKDFPRVSIKRGTKAFPVIKIVYNIFDRETKKRYTMNEFQTLSEEEKAKLTILPHKRVYYVFNVAQTNLEEARPELYERLKKESGIGTEKDQGENKSHEAIDKMIDDNLYYCPIKQVRGDSAYYSLSKDEIVLPIREQFRDGESFASNALHECAHATGAAGRLNRFEKASFGSNAYAIEELIAEMTAAVVCAKYGMTKHISDDSAAYAKSWIKNLKQDPQFIRTLLEPIRKAAKMLEQRIEAVAAGEKVTFDKHNEEITK